MYDAATLWDYADYAFCSFNAMKEMAVNYEDGNKLTEAHFFVEDAAQLDNVIAEVQNISSINWDHFIILPMTRCTRIFPAHSLIPILW